MVSSFLTWPNQEGIREQQTNVGINTPLSLWGAYFKWIHIFICYLRVKPPALCSFFFPSNTTFCLYLLLLPQNSNSPYTATPWRRFALFFFFFPNTATLRRCFALFFFFPNAATPRRCSDALMQPSVFFPKPRRRSLSWHDLLPSTKHRTKDEDYRLRQWWISSTEPLFKGFWKGHGLIGLSNLHGFFF